MKVLQKSFLVLSLIAMQSTGAYAAVSAPEALARRIIASGNPRQALKVLTPAICANPSDLSLRRCYVETLIKTGQCSAAAKEMQGLVKVGLRSSEDFTLLADAYRYCGELRAALLNYQEALNIAPDFAPAQSGMAFCYMLCGQQNRAEKVCKDAMTQIKDDAGRRLIQRTILTLKEFKPAAPTEKLALVDGIRF
ncbi:MAG: tetratricopeptide repeat protein [Candidatus Obscuribacterales bacterium]|nr:tetratricopeptide repeat protein [Candidatus Obscuribacterales bacterium]